MSKEGCGAGVSAGDSRGKWVRTFSSRAEISPYLAIRGSGENIELLAYFSDEARGDRVISYGADCTIRMWDIVSQDCLKEMLVRDQVIDIDTWNGPDGRAYFSMLYTNGTVGIIDVDAWSEVEELKVGIKCWPRRIIYFSGQDGRGKIAICGKEKTEIWDLSAKKCECEIDYDGELCADFSRLTRWGSLPEIACVGKCGIGIIDLFAGRYHQVLRWGESEWWTSFAFHCHEDSLLIAASAKEEIRIIQLHSGVAYSLEWAGHKDRSLLPHINNLAFFIDQQGVLKLAAAGESREVWVWNPLLDEQTPKVLRPRGTFSPNDNYFSVHAYESVSGPSHLLSTTQNGDIYIWDMEGEVSLQAAREKSPTVVDIVPFIYRGQWRVAVATESEIQVWTAGSAAFEMIAGFPQRGISRCFLDADRKRIIVASSCNGIAIRDLDSLELVTEIPFKVNRDNRDTVCLCEDGLLAIAADKGLIQLWSVMTGEKTWDLSFEGDEILALRAGRTRESRHLLAAIVGGQGIVVWDIRGPALVNEHKLKGGEFVYDCLPLDAHNLLAIDYNGGWLMWDKNADEYRYIEPSYECDGPSGRLIWIDSEMVHIAMANWDQSISLFDSCGRLIDVIQLEAVPTAIAALAGAGIAVGYGDGWEVYECG
ncbi:MAG: WD40 repeat domain-containing protein [Actinomycetaceae bacterium]|nr:WD40 repeat domain-containing protein [Actinomycetaceae bacterium]